MKSLLFAATEEEVQRDTSVIPDAWAAAARAAKPKKSITTAATTANCCDSECWGSYQPHSHLSVKNLSNLFLCAVVMLPSVHLTMQVRKGVSLHVRLLSDAKQAGCLEANPSRRVCERACLPRCFCLPSMEMVKTLS